MFGAMPSDFMLFEVSEEPSAEEEEAEDQQNNTSDLDVSKWDLKRRCALGSKSLQHVTLAAV